MDMCYVSPDDHSTKDEKKNMSQNQFHRGPYSLRWHLYSLYAKEEKVM